MSNWYQGAKEAHNDAQGYVVVLVVVLAPFVIGAWLFGVPSASAPGSAPTPIQVAPVVSETKREKAWQGWRGR